MSTGPETVEVAAAKAATRWKWISAGLAIVAFTNFLNLYLNTEALERPAGGLTCVAVIGNDSIADQLVRERRRAGDQVMVAR